MLNLKILQYPGQEDEEEDPLKLKKLRRWGQGSGRSRVSRTVDADTYDTDQGRTRLRSFMGEEAGTAMGDSLTSILSDLLPPGQEVIDQISRDRPQDKYGRTLSDPSLPPLGVGVGISQRMQEEQERLRDKSGASFEDVQSGGSSSANDKDRFFQNPADAARQAFGQQAGLWKQAGAGLGEVLPTAAVGAGKIFEGITPFEVPGLDEFESLLDRRREESAPEGAGEHIARFGARALGEGSLASTGGIGLAAKGAKVAGLGGLLSDLGISNVIAQAGPEESLAGGASAVAGALGLEKQQESLGEFAQDPIKRAILESIGVAGMDAAFRGVGRFLGADATLRPRKSDEPRLNVLDEPQKFPLETLDDAPVGFTVTPPAQRAAKAENAFVWTEEILREKLQEGIDVTKHFRNAAQDFDGPLPGEAIIKPGGAATWVDGKIVIGSTHAVSRPKAGARFDKEVIDGFVTTRARFVTREQAQLIDDAFTGGADPNVRPDLDSMRVKGGRTVQNLLDRLNGNLSEGTYRKVGDDLWEAPDGSKLNTMDVAGVMGLRESVEAGRTVDGFIKRMAARGVPNPEASASMRAKIQSGSGNRWKLRNVQDVREYFSGLYSRFLDRDWKVAGRNLESLGISAKRNPYFTGRVLYGAAGPGSHWFRRGFTDINSTKILAPAFEDIIRTAKDPNKFDEALVAMRALDYPALKDGSRAGFTKAEIDNALSYLNDPDIAKASRMWKQLQDQVLDVMENGNAPLVKKGTKAKLLKSSKGANNFYVPFVRSRFKFLKSTAGFTHEPAAMRIREPGAGDVYSPIETMAQNLFVLGELMMRRQHMSALAESAAKGNPALVDVTDTVKNLKTLETGKGAPLDGIVAEQLLEHMTDETRDMLQAFTNAEGEVLIRLKNAAGEPRIYKTDQSVLDALTIMPPRDFKMWERMMIGSSRILRTTIVGSINWLSTAFGRDLLTSAITKWMPDTPWYRVDQRTKAALLDGAWGAYELTKDALNRSLGTNFSVDDLIRLRETGGGAIGELTGGDRAEMGREIGFLLPHTLTTYGKVRRAMHILGEVIVTPGRVLENAPRSGEMRSVYNWARSQGMSHEDAAVMASAKNRDVTLDFLRHGSAFKTGGGEKFAGFDGELLRLSDAFYNVGLIGWDRMARAFLDPATRKQAAATSVALVTVPSISLWALNTQLDEEMAIDYYNIDEVQRRLYWHVPLPGLSAETIPDFLRYDPKEKGDKKNYMKPFAVGGAGHVWFRWPKPFEYGLIFGAIPESILESVDPRNPYRETWAQELTRKGEQMFTDQLVTFIPFPTAGDVANLNPFEAWTSFGKSQALSEFEEAQNKADIAKGYDKGSALSQKVADMGFETGLFDISPPRMDEAVQSQFGSYGRTLSDFIQRETDKHNGIAPARRFHEQQLATRFFRSSGEALGGAAQGKFWDELRALEKDYNSAKQFLDSNPDRAYKFALPEEELDRLNVLRTFADDINDWREQLEVLDHNEVDPESGEEFPTDPEERRELREWMRERVRVRYQIATMDPEGRARLARTKVLDNEEMEYIRILNRIDGVDEETIGSIVRPR